MPSQTVSASRFVLAGLLCVEMALPASLLAQQGPEMRPADSAVGDLPMQTAAVKVAPVSQKLTGDDPYLLVLDRFTYGARPGDLERMKTVGLSGWFSEQMNPQRVDESALNAKLVDYPAMQMPLNKLMELYPTNAEIKASIEGRMSAPGGDAAHAIYADNEARYKAKKANGKKKDMDDNSVDVVPLPIAPADLLAMPADKRFKEICHLSVAQIKQVRQELPAAQREHLTDGFTPPQLEAMAAFQSPRGVVEAEDVQVKLLRDIYSERQLQEVMVDFWLNHFNVYIGKSQQAPYYIAAYERNSIRPFALGRFQDLLISTAVSPAMLNYLDASESVGPHSEFVIGFNQRQGNGKNKRPSGLNENYAREVMELHTVGVNGGYSQKDVTELAKAFTGWTVGKRRGQDVLTTAQFDPAKHEPGDKTVMGHKIKMNGQGEGMEALKMLASSPQCAKFISTKLAVRFVGDSPSPAMIDRMSSTFLQTNGDIRKVLLAMVNSPDFFTTATYRAKVKTPQDYVVSAVRAAGSQVQSTSGLATAISDLGMPLYGMQTPNGYSMKTDAWNSTGALVSRMNFAMALASNRVHGVTTDLDALLGPQAAAMSSEQKTKTLEAQLLKVPVSPRTQQLILAQTAVDGSQQAAELRQVSNVAGKRNPLEVRGGRAGGVNDVSGLDTQAALAAGLIFGSPEFQRR